MQIILVERSLTRSRLYTETCLKIVIGHVRKVYHIPLNRQID